MRASGNKYADRATQRLASWTVETQGVTSNRIHPIRGDHELRADLAAADCHRAIRADGIDGRIGVHPRPELGSTSKQRSDEKLTLDVPDRIRLVQQPLLENVAVLVERASLAQNDAVSTDSVKQTEAFKDTQTISFDENPGADLAHGAAALVNVDRPAF
jgi:hypothetical protein